MLIKSVSFSVYRGLLSSARHFSKIPKTPCSSWEEQNKKPSSEPDISPDLVNHLERLALVDFGNQEGVDRLAAAVKFADQLKEIPTKDVLPMSTVLEYWPLYMREDEVSEGGDAQAILKNAKKLDEDYFVAPPGNIPLKHQDRAYMKESQAAESSEE